MGDPFARSLVAGSVAFIILTFTVGGALDPEVPIPASVAIVGAAASLPFIAFAIACYTIPENVGRGRTTVSKALRRLAAACGYEVQGCGCAYTGRINFGPDQPNTTTVESDEVFVRRENGARVTFRRHERGLKRCHRCGRHYHFTEATDPDWRHEPLADHRYECWPEDEPEIRDQLDADVVEGVDR